jgi:dephospho-CoA kinase
MGYQLKPEYIKHTHKTRLHGLHCPIIAITGGIASGKSEVLAYFKQQHLKVISADGLIKEIYQLPESIIFIKTHAPEAFLNNEINFPILRKLFFENKKLKSLIEEFLYKKLPDQFYSHIKPEDQLILYEVPLLFERKLESFFDFNIVVSTNLENQKSRIKQRDQSDDVTIQNIVSSQIPMQEKCAQAHLVIKNDSDLKYLHSQCQNFINQYLIDTKN